MKVTIRDVKRPDHVLQDFTVIPHYGLPYVGCRIRLGRGSWQPKNQRARVVDYEWFMADEAPTPVEVWMLVDLD
jgi:hypothetical protein